MKFEPPDIMGIPPEELKTILSLPGDEHFRSESLDRVALTSGFLPCKWRERDILGPRVYCGSYCSTDSFLQTVCVTSDLNCGWL